MLLTDTVGFIRKLPHHLIDAFRSTLEEAKYADIIIHMVDSSNPALDSHIHTVYETLTMLGIEDKIIITVFNKQDKVDDKEVLRDFKADYTVYASVKTGQGLDELNSKLSEALRSMRVNIEKVFDYSEAGKLGLIRKYGQLLKEDYKDEGIYVEAYVPAELYEKI